MKRLSIILILLACVSFGYATPALPGTIGHAAGSTTDDMSLRYLSEMFGAVGNAYSVRDVRPTLLAEIFSVFNKGIIALASGWTIYSMFSIFFNSAMEGGFVSGQRKHAAFIFARLAIGFSFLLPLGSGYNAIQIIGMKVIVQGVNLANEVWDRALLFLSHDGKFYYGDLLMTSSGKAAKEHVVDKNITAGWTDKNKVAQNILSSLVCSAYSAKSNAIGSQNYAPQRAVKDGTDYIEFPGNSNGGDVKPAHCGKVKLNQVTVKGYKKADPTLISALVNDLRPVAQQYVDSTCTYNSKHPNTLPNCPDPKNSLVTDPLAQGVLNALTDYAASYTMQAHLKAEQTDRGDHGGDDNIAKAAYQGWFGAGRFYWYLTSEQSNKNKGPSDTVNWPLSSSRAISMPGSATQTASHFNGDVSTYITALSKSYGRFGSDAVADTGVHADDAGGAGLDSNGGSLDGGPSRDRSYNDSGVCTTWTNGKCYTASWDGYNWSQTTMSHPDVIAPFGIIPLGIFITDIKDTFADLQSTNNKSTGLLDPLYFTTHLGFRILNDASIMWAATEATDAGLTTIGAIASYEAPAVGEVFNALIAMQEPILISISGVSFAAGFMLAYYAPLYPFILFLFGGLNWLMVCVEFMVALPLVALGITHPEGHDFLGKAEIALMLTLSAALRPVLMIFGYLSGIILSYIGFSALNYMFAQVMVMNNGGSGNESVLDSVYTATLSSHNLNASAWAMVMPLLLMMYGYLVIEIVHFSFTMIHQLPDQVLKWIGGPVGQDRTQGITDKTKSGMQGASKQGGEQAGKAASDYGKNMTKGGGKLGGRGVQIAATNYRANRDANQSSSS